MIWEVSHLSMGSFPRALFLGMGSLPFMAEDWKSRLQRVLKERGLDRNLKQVSKAAGLSETGMRDLLTRTGDPRLSSLTKVAAYLRLPMTWLIEGEDAGTPRIPIVGLVSAGESWEAIDEEAMGPDEFAEDFTLSGADPIGLRVQGTSMLPVYRPGDILMGSRTRGAAIEAALNQDCIIRTATGDSFVKVLRPGAGRGLFTLRSYNHAYPDIENIALEWVAPVVWVKRG